MTTTQASPLDFEVPDIDLLQRTLSRERRARQLAECLLEEKARELFLANELLNRMVQMAAETDSYENALEHCVEMVCKTINWPVGHVYCISDDNTVELFPSDIWHLSDPERFSALKAITMTTSFKVGKGLPGMVMELGEPVWISDMTADDNFPRGSLGEIGVKGAFAFPIKSKGEVIAVLEFFALEVKLRDDRLLTMMQSISEQLSRVVERKQSQEELKLINEGLEQKVLARTAEIQSVNQQLEGELLERKKLEGQLVQSEKMASLGQMAAGVAHEINNPVGFVTSNLSTLTEYVGVLKSLIEHYDTAANVAKELNLPDLDSPLAEIEKVRTDEDLDFIMDDLDSLLSESQEGVERVKEIVSNLKSFARVDEAEEKETDINECAQSALKIVGNELKYKCKVHTEFGDLPKVQCNPGQLNQVIMNLLVNASQAIPDQGDVTIKTTDDNENVFISITDTGSGIEPEHLEQIFNPFFTTKPVGKGTGLGLSIVYGIIEKHGGTIKATSEVGAGTTFTVQLPKHAPSDTVETSEVTA